MGVTTTKKMVRTPKIQASTFTADPLQAPATGNGGPPRTVQPGRWSSPGPEPVARPCGRCPRLHPPRSLRRTPPPPPPPHPLRTPTALPLDGADQRPATRTEYEESQ